MNLKGSIQTPNEANSAAPTSGFFVVGGGDSFFSIFGDEVSPRRRHLLRLRVQLLSC